jgi:hypothetical protein
VHRIEEEIAELDAKRPSQLGEKEREHLMELGADLERAWSHPAAGASTRKRILAPPTPKPPQIRGGNDGFNHLPIPLGTSRSLILLMFVNLSVIKIK